MSYTIALEGNRPVGVTRRRAAGGGAGRTLRRAVGLFDDALWLLLAGLAIPVAILLVGIPIALVITLLLEIAQRLF